MSKPTLPESYARRAVTICNSSLGQVATLEALRKLFIAYGKDFSIEKMDSMLEVENEATFERFKRSEGGIESEKVS